MFELLSTRLSKIFSKLSRKKNLTESNISDTLNDIKKALLASDVNFEVVQQLITDVKASCIGQKVFKNVQPGQQVVKIVYDKLVDLLGEKQVPLSENRPLTVMMVGLQGSGKTTACAKLAKQLKDAGSKPCLIACDIYRPAAIDQLRILGQQIDVPVFSYENLDVSEIAKRGIKDGQASQCDVFIIDTAGRLQIDTMLMDEVKALKSAVNPQEILWVMDSALGQEAVTIAKGFNEALNVSGIVVSKLDGDAKAGAILSVKTALHVPIKFASVGEKLDLFEPFYPDRIASRILGMGDIVSLVEKAQSELNDETVMKYFSGEFTLDDFLSQLQKMKKVGSLSQISKWLPGIANEKLMERQEKEMLRMEVILQSMTPQERRYPHLLNSMYRRNRIIKGAGVKISDYNLCLKKYQSLKKMMSKLSKKNPDQLRAMMDQINPNQFLK